jgi:hypothetical protein
MLKLIQVGASKNIQFSQEIEPNRYLTHSFTAREMATLLSVTLRTVQRWMKKGDFPPWLDRHISMLTGAHIASKGWRGFYFSEGSIYTPAGHKLSPGALETLAWRNQENRALWRRLALQELAITRQKVATDYWREKAGAPLAANDED